VNALDNRVRDAQSDIPALTARAPLTDNKDSGLIFKKISDLVSAQMPDFGNFGNGIVPF
jgi:hypothetical protein